MRVDADRETCVGAGQCALVAPKIFDQDDDGIVEVLMRDVHEVEDEQGARRAAALCPARAISLRDS